MTQVNMTKPSLYIRILLAILMVCCFGELVWSQTARESYLNTLSTRSFSCTLNQNASVSYLNNANNLYSEFIQQSSTTHYYNTSIGATPNRVYGYFMCRADISTELCNSCIINGTRMGSFNDTLGPTCQYLDGQFISEPCIFRYSNQSMQGLWQVPISYQFEFLRVNVSNSQQFNQTLSSTMEDVIFEAAFGSQNSSITLGFATQEGTVSGNETIYSLAQCTPDIVGVNCSLCLRFILSRFTSLANGAPAAYGNTNKCYLRYDNISFYNV